MRHFSCTTSTPSALAGRMSSGSSIAALVTSPGTLQRFPAAVHSARTRAIGVATITVPADPHLHTAACAAVEPIGIFAHRPARAPKDWTTPCIAGIKGMRLYPEMGYRDAEGPGFSVKN